MANSEVIGRAVPAQVAKRRVARANVRTPVAKLAIGMAVILAAIGFLVYQGLTHSLVFYITPSELLAKGKADVGVQLQLGGQVRPGSKQWNPTTHVLTFVLQDPKAHVLVTSNGLPPPLFRAGIGAVVQGTYSGGIFHATSVLVKHSATYVAPKPGQLPKSDGYVHK